MDPKEGGVNILDTDMNNERVITFFSTRVSSERMAPSSGENSRKDARVPLFTGEKDSIPFTKCKVLTAFA